MPSEQQSKELVVIHKDNLPETIDLLLGHPWSKDAMRLIKYGPELEYDQYGDIDDRGNQHAFQELVEHCKANNLNDTHTYAMMVGMAKKWGVVLDNDREEFFLETIKRAVDLPGGTKLAQELSGEIVENDPFTIRGTKLYGFRDLLRADFTINWIMDGILTEQGVICFSGEPGVGKTQLLAQWCIALATGGEFLGFKVTDGRPRKILFLSLEMYGGEIKTFIAKMAKELSEEQQDILQENFIFWPHGNALYLNDPVDRAEYIKILDIVQPDGVIIDSWSMAAKGNLSDDTVTRDAFAFVNFMRGRNNTFVGIINHTKKRQNADHKPNTMDDIFGSRFFSAALSNAIVVWAPDKKKPNDIELHIVKSRFAPKPGEPLLIRRIPETLNFMLEARSVNAMDILIPKDAVKQLDIEAPKPKGLNLPLSEIMGFGEEFKFFMPNEDGEPEEVKPIKKKKYSKTDDTIEGFSI